MEFNFIKFKPTESYLTLTDPRAKLRYVCFSNKPACHMCTGYIAKFRSVYGYFPHFDMTSTVKKVEKKKTMKKRSTDEVLRYFEMETIDREALDELARLHNVSFFYVHEFEFGDSIENILFKGQEVDGVANLDAYIDRMEYKLKIG